MGWQAGLLFPVPYHAVLVVKVCSHLVRLRPGGRLRTLTTALRRAGAGLGQSRPIHGGDYRPAEAGEVLQAAQRLLGQKLQGREVLTSPQAVRDFLRVKLGALEHEVFAVLMLDSQNRLIEYVEL